MLRACLPNCWDKEWQTGYLSRGNGQSYYPNRSASFSRYHGQVLSFTVWGWESDADYGEFSPSPLRPLGCWTTSINAGHESSNIGDWARAVTNINFNIAPFVHTQSTATETWTFLSPSAAKLRYKIYVTLNFNYGGSASPIARSR
jgi:hypothetical protein